MDKIEAQVEMEKLFHKNQAKARILAEFKSSDIDFQTAFMEANIPEKFGYDLLVQMVLHKRVNVPTLVGIMRNHFDGDCALTMAMLEAACRADIMDFDTTSERFIVVFDIDSTVQHEIDSYQYPMPMIVEPLPLNTNRDTGYYTHRDSVILRNNHHDDDVCLDLLNKLNRTKLRINSNTVAFLKNKWRNLERPKPGETRTDFQKRVQAFVKYDRMSREVITHLETHGGEFYLTHKYDKRGRVYCQGYHVSYQGNDWNKACIEFANGEPLE